MARSMSGQTAAWRSRYSVSRSGRTWRVKQTRGTGGAPRVGPCRRRTGPAAAGPTTSEVEVVDVLGVEDRRVTEDDDAVGLDGELAQLAGLEGLALGTGDLARGERGAGVRGQVAELLGVPQREGLHGAVLHVLAHLVRR